MKYTKGTEELGLPEIYRFGVELEAFNVNVGRTTKSNPSLYKSPESKQFLKEHRWKTANVLQESLVGKGGAECVSPILYDTESDWQNLHEVCEHMKRYPGKYGNEVVADDKCGCHVHFDARALTGRNVQETEKMMSTFLRLWAESEELIYKMCNATGQPIRDGALINKKKGLTWICLKLQHIKGMASPTGKKILKSIQKGNLKVSYKKFGILKRVIALGKLDPRRYHGLNLTNIGNPRKNTIEFRMSNGSLDAETIKKNVYLYASILQAARNITLEPEKNKAKTDEFYRTDVSEEQKVNSLLALLFENETDRNIYKERWESVKEAPIFANNEKDFAQGRFQRDEFKKIAQRTPVSWMKDAFAQLKQMVQQRGNENRGEMVNDGPEI